MIKDQIARINSDISLICQKIPRDPQEITLVGVTKYASKNEIKEAMDAGLTDIGENKVQEALKKFSFQEEVKPKVTKHMIGHLQTNKVKQALKVFDLIQTVDSIKLAEKIEKEADRLNKIVDILVQVRTSEEMQKYGVSKEGVLDLLEPIAELKHIRIKGLMTIASYVEDQEEVRICFRKLRQIFDEMAMQFSGVKNVQMIYLSMGMTADYKIALEEGSNMIRIGRAIFSP